MTIALLTILATAALAFANGGNDVSRGVATLAGSGRATYRNAIAWGTLWTGIGAVAALGISMGLVKAFTSALVGAELLASPIFPLAVATGAAAWVLVASATGLPVSTTHALAGAIVGVALTAGGAGSIHWWLLLSGIAAPLALSPLISGGIVSRASTDKTMTRRRALAVAVLAAAVVAAVWFLPLAEWTMRLAELARGTGPSGVAVFFAVYVVSTIALLPGSILTLVAGFAYGPVWGLAIASPASVTGATCAFLLGRTLLRDWAARKVGGSARARAIDAAVEREGFKLVLLLRLSPLFPFNLLNYVLGLSRVGLGTYVLASFLGMLPATALYVYLGSLAPAAAELAAAAEEGDTMRMALYVAGLLATVAVVVIGARAARRALDAELQRAA